jgi:restriction system protein
MTVTSRQGVLATLADSAQKIDWRASAALAVVSVPLLHMAAVALKSPPDMKGTDFGAIYLNALSWTFSSILQFAVPLLLLAIATYSYINRSRSNRALKATAASIKARLNNITVNDFEELVGEGFRRRGYGVSENRRGGTIRHIDLMLTKNTALFFVQCKLWHDKNVDEYVIRELHAIVSDKGANGGCVVTSSNFTDAARLFATSCGITLIDRAGLNSLIGPALAPNKPRYNSLPE